MKLGLVLNRVNPEEKAIILAAKKHGVEVVQFNDQRLKLSINAEMDITPDVDVFLQRSLSHSRAQATTAIIENKGYKIINSTQCLEQTGNKLTSSLILTKNGIPTPATHVAFKVNSAIEIGEEELEYPYITKPIVGSWGRLVSKINDSSAAAAVFESRDVLGSPMQKIYYLQEFHDSTKVRKDAPIDIRVFYLGGKCIAAMGRYPKEGEFRSNISIGGSAKPYEITPEVDEVCQKIASAFGGEILGIDLMETKDGFTCIEVNGTPGFSGISKATGIDIGEQIVLYLKKKYEKN